MLTERATNAAYLILTLIGVALIWALLKPINLEPKPPTTVYQYEASDTGWYAD